MVSSQKEINPQELLTEFAGKCKESVAPNGDKQEDGWGVAWLDDNQQWQVKKSLKPIWEDQRNFNSIPETKAFVVHARSATFPTEKGNVSYNQPYINGKYCFVFNGSIKGVKLNRPVEGEIGSQKIWTLLKEQLETNSIADSLKCLEGFLEKNSKGITALNIGIATSDSLNALCKYNTNRKYYTLFYTSEKLNVISSEELNKFPMAKINNSKILNLNLT